MGERVSVELIGRAVEGDRSATDAICRAYEPRLRGFFYARGTPRDEIDDLVQETLLCLLTALRAGTIAADSHEGWVFAVARNLHANAARRRCRERDLDSGRNVDDIPAPDDLSHGEETRRLLGEIRLLPPRYRLPIVLFYRSGLSYRDIAERLGTNQRTVGTWLHRGRRLLGGIRNRPD